MLKKKNTSKPASTQPKKSADASTANNASKPKSN